MGLRILLDKDSDKVVWYCSTTMQAFGPVFENAEVACGFQNWLYMTKDVRDPRILDSTDLYAYWEEFQGRQREKEEANEDIKWAHLYKRRYENS